MKKKYKISLITACYNIETRRNVNFEDYLDSIRNQTIGYSNIEHILVNDGSSDNTGKILEKLSEDYDNVLVYNYEKNNGYPGIPRNKGIQLASSEYVMFLDQDDRYVEDAMETLYNEIESNNVDFVTSNYYIYDGNLQKRIVKEEKRVVLNKDSPDLFLAETSSSSTIYNRQFLLDNDIKYSKQQAEDYYFIINSILLTQKKIIVLNNFCTQIFTTSYLTSLSHDFDKIQLLSCIEVFTELMDKILNSNIHSNFASEFYRETIRVLIGFMLRTNETEENKKVMFLSLNDYFNRYDYIKTSLEVYWRFLYLLIIKNQYHLIKVSSWLLKLVFENKIFKKLFRNKEYELQK